MSRTAQEHFDSNVERVLGSAGARYRDPLAFSRLKMPGAAFTLIEIIGVLAVLSIIAAVLAPVIIQKVDDAARSRDATELSGMASALKAVILRTGGVPDPPHMIQAIATELGVATNQVIWNSRNVQRRFLIDPGFWIGPSGSLPYVQSVTPGGTLAASNGRDVPGLNLRILILSSLSDPLPGTSDFNIAWSTPDKTKPADWTTWNGAGVDLRIQRVDLAPLFHHVILNRVDADYSGSFAIENGGVSSTTNIVVGISNAWYLGGTVLCLYDTNSGPTSYALESKVVIQNDLSYVFENRGWHSQLCGWGTNGPVALDSSLAAAFTWFANVLATAPASPNSQPAQGDSTVAIVGDLFAFMNDYNFWARQGFVAGADNAWPNLLTDYVTITNVAWSMRR